METVLISGALMDSIKRVEKAVKHSEPDRLPVNCGRIDDLEFWKESFKVKDENELRKYFGLDLRKNAYKGIFNVEKGKSIWGASDDWDAGYGTTRGGFPLEKASTIKDIENYKWPTKFDVDYNEFKNRVLAMDREYPVILSLGYLAPFNTLLDMMGMEKTLTFMYESPEVIEAALVHIEEFLLSTMKKVLEDCAEYASFFWCADDFSTQRGLMISPEMWRKFFRPVYKKKFDLIKSYNKPA
jgi:uroporphyrinogen decarboxylase